MKYTLMPMDIDDYEEVYDLWCRTEGITLTLSDSRAALEAYLHRNPGLSLVSRVTPRQVAPL